MLLLLRRTICLTALVSIVAVGCSPSQPLGSVTGKVTYQGNPVTEGEVQVFLEQKGIGASAKLDGSGAFTIETPIPTGVYAVCVVPPPEMPGSASIGKSFANIPRKAQDTKTSGLTMTVKEGKNVVPIELKD